MRRIYNADVWPIKTMLDLTDFDGDRARFRRLEKSLAKNKEPYLEAREGRILYFQFKDEKSLKYYETAVTKSLERGNYAFKKV